MKSQMDTARIWVYAAARMIRMTVMMMKPAHSQAAIERREYDTHARHRARLPNSLTSKIQSAS